MEEGKSSQDKPKNLRKKKLTQGILEIWIWESDFLNLTNEFIYRVDLELHEYVGMNLYLELCML